MPEQNEVNIAFELLLEEIENVIEELNKEAEETFKSRDYEKVKSLIEDATKITDFREKIRILQKEWQTLFAPKAPKIKKIRKDEKSKKLKRGLRTPEDAFRIPILESLAELGGKAEVRTVLNEVYKKMKHILNEYDRQQLPSGTGIRWQNTAQWARNTMVQEGLLS
ncbi:MAG: winged helix-turn-helix domain-containing protein, partial [Thermodesulfovibrio sp.]|nr:winged helix-turn-helix domain-containing protein [Thermodesulfovibrio sp.]